MRASCASRRNFPSRDSRPASQPGNWTVRAVSNGSVAFSRSFTIAADTDNGGPVVSSVTWSGERAQEIDFTVKGKNFQPGSLVLIAQYKPSGGWTYIANLQARDATADSNDRALRGAAGQ